MAHTRLRKPLWPGEVDRLLASCDKPRERLVVLALLETGISNDELLALEPRDIDWHNGKLKAAHGRPAIKLSIELRRLLKRHLEPENLLPHTDRQIQRIVKAVGDRAGMQVTPDHLQLTHQMRTAYQSPGHILLEAANRASDMILIVDDHRLYVEINEAAVAAIGEPRHKILGRRIEEFFGADDRPVTTIWPKFLNSTEQIGICQLKRDRTRYLYRARANFVPGLHVSILRPLSVLDASQVQLTSDDDWEP